MKRYIDKDALAVEIEKRIENLISLSESCPANTAGRTGFYAQAQTLEGIKNFINALEVKEMDLEEELDSYFAKFKGLENWNWRIDSVNIHAQGIYDFAKHFFELGLKAQKGEQK